MRHPEYINKLENMLKKLKYEAVKINKKLGKSHRTQDNRLNTINQLIAHLGKENIGHASLELLRVIDVELHSELTHLEV